MRCRTERMTLSTPAHNRDVQPTKPARMHGFVGLVLLAQCLHVKEVHIMHASAVIFTDQIVVCPTIWES